MLFRQSFYLRKVFQTDRDAQGVTDLVCSHVAQDFILTVFQVTKMNMAMGIDIHGAMKSLNGLKAGIVPNLSLIGARMAKIFSGNRVACLPEPVWERADGQRRACGR